jgi:hypothetical protein
MSKFLDETITKPPVQAALLLGGNLLFMSLGWAAKAMGWMTRDPLFAWSTAAAMLLFFALFNSLMSIRAPHFGKYWGASMYSYMALALLSGCAAWLFSGIGFREAGTYRWIFIVVSFCFLVFLSMVNFMKIIVNFAQREEWNQPRRR